MLIAHLAANDRSGRCVAAQPTSVHGAGRILTRRVGRRRVDAAQDPRVPVNGVFDFIADVVVGCGIHAITSLPAGSQIERPSPRDEDLLLTPVLHPNPPEAFPYLLCVDYTTKINVYHATNLCLEASFVGSRMTEGRCLLILGPVGSPPPPPLS